MYNYTRVYSKKRLHWFTDKLYCADKIPKTLGKIIFTYFFFFYLITSLLFVSVCANYEAALIANTLLRPIQSLCLWSLSIHAYTVDCSYALSSLNGAESGTVISVRQLMFIYAFQVSQKKKKECATCS